MLERDVILVNIANAETTRTAEGGCYLRQTVEVDAEGIPSVAADNESATRMVYDPAHPDAVQTGSFAGYIEYPNVNVDFERKELDLVELQLDTVRLIISHMDPSLVVPDYKEGETHHALVF
jgi:flagellar basal body rod protein FlgC